jgi:hypothetical protein
MSTCAAFVMERRIKFANATKFNRKSGGSAVEGPAVIHHLKPISIKATTLRLVIPTVAKRRDLLFLFLEFSHTLLGAVAARALP